MAKPFAIRGKRYPFNDYGGILFNYYLQYNVIFDRIKLRLLMNDVKIAFYWDFYTLIEKYLVSLHRNHNIMGL